VNALSNTIKRSNFSWINSPYIYIWPCPLDGFDYVINHMKFLKVKKFNCWGSKEKYCFVLPFG
jgi:hypothetical protein